MKASINRVTLISRFVLQVFPLVKQELSFWQEKAAEIPDLHLRSQALESIRLKTFHCQGGSIYALYPGASREGTIRFIVAYQTISDYLDNLVDSLGVDDESAFAQLHLAMTESLDPEAVPSDYYKFYPYRQDGGYLKQLVKTCQMSVKALPSYPKVKENALQLAGLYSSLQTYKHLGIERRESAMLQWIEPYLKQYPGVTAWEFAAASGSTLGIFCYFAAAHNPLLSGEEVKMIRQAYFPWICGLHILLDYFIDLSEDRDTEQLNFVAYYDSPERIAYRFTFFIEASYKRCLALRYPRFERSVVQGLLAMYLSDRKSQDSEIRGITGQILSKSGTGVKVLYKLCRRLRARKVLK